MRHWTLEEATAALPEVRIVVQHIRELVATARAQAQRVTGNGAGGRSTNGDAPSAPVDAGELRALVKELAKRGVAVRDPARGLIDFPALAPDGRTYLLCWHYGPKRNVRSAAIAAPTIPA